MLRSTSGKDVQPFIRISNNWNSDSDSNAPKLVTSERSKEIERFLVQISGKVVEQTQEQPVEIEYPELDQPAKLVLATEFLNILRPISARKPAGIQ